MAYTEAGKRATMKYIKSAYDRIEIKIPKGQKSTVQAHADSKGESVNGMVSRVILADMGLSEWPEGKEE